MKVKEGEPSTEIVTCLVAKWLNECDIRAKVMDMIVMKQFITILPESGLKSMRKPGTSMIAGKLAEDYQQAKKNSR